MPISNAEYAKWRLQALKDDIFFREAVILDDRTGKHIKMEPVHISWLNHMYRCKEHGKHCAILAPWGIGKSVQIAIAESLRIIGKNQNIRVKIVNAIDQYAIDRVRTITKYINDSEEYHAVYPQVKRGDGQWTDHRIYIQRETNAIDPTIEARGIFSTGISGRADVLIFDDPVDNTSIYSEKVRASAREAYRNTWMSRLVDDGFVLYIATRWHEDDLTKTIIESGRYEVLVQRVSDDFSCIEQELIV